MRCRVIKPGFVRRKFGARIKSVLVEPPAEIDWPAGTEVPAWLEPVSKLEPVPPAGGDTPSPSDSGEAHIPPADEPAGGEGPAKQEDDPVAAVAEINGIGPDRARALVAMGIRNPADFVAIGESDPEALIGMPGISARNIKSLIAHAKKLMEA